MNTVVNLYKRVGETPLEALTRLRNENPLLKDQKMTYAGRLDPMAKGVLIVLVGDAVYDKDNYTALPKKYDFELLLGVETDTLDVLGCVEKIENTAFPSKEELEKAMSLYRGVIDQKYPLYSSKTVEGVPLWSRVRSGESGFVTPSHEVEIYSLVQNEIYTLTCDEIFSSVYERVGYVNGDFRQDMIRESWKKEFLNKKNKGEKSVCISFSAHVSSGTYIRVLASDIAHALGTVGIAYAIVRTSVGEYDGVVE